MGYEFELVNLIEAYEPAVAGARDPADAARSLPTCGPLAALAVAYRQAQAIEAVEDFVRMNVGFEVERGAMQRVSDRFLRDLRTTRTLRAVRELQERVLAELAAVPIDKPAYPLRVGVVGELYLLMEPFANCGVERKLAEAGVEVHRFITLTHRSSATRSAAVSTSVARSMRPDRGSSTTSARTRPRAWRRRGSS